MAKRSKTVVGLDIDPSGITAVQASVNGHVRVERAALAPLEAGILREGEIVDVDGLAQALRTLYAENRGLGKRVRIGVASQKIVVRVLELPPISDAAELETAIRFQAQDELPMALDSAVLDHQTLGIVDHGSGPRQRVLLVAARRESVDRVLAAVHGAGLRPEGIDLSAFAMVRALHRAGPEGEQVLYLGIGGLINLAVAQSTDCLFTRATGGGVESLAIELAERRTLTLEHARGWLEHVGLDAATETIDGDAEIIADAREVLREGARRIAAEVRNTLDFHLAQGPVAAAITRAVLTGPAAAIPGFATTMAAELGMPVEEGLVEGAPGIAPGRLAVAAGLSIDRAPRA